jgi:hypothetical protein
MLLIFDFSGTLSVAAVQFGTPEYLARALQQSGLAALGVDETVYWHEIVTPTWEEGSTSTIGLANLIARRVCAIGGAPEPAYQAAQRFTQMYMAASAIDPAWQPLFDAVRSIPTAIPLIATDHYAEATLQITTQLTALGWQAASLRVRRGHCRAIAQYKATRPYAIVPGTLFNHRRIAFIANSADLGVIKATPRFWQWVRMALGVQPLRIVLVDDFGASENLADFYANPERVAHRRQQTVAALQRVFAAPIQTVQFVLDRPLDRTVTEVTELIQRYQWPRSR